MYLFFYLLEVAGDKIFNGVTDGLIFYIGLYPFLSFNILSDGGMFFLFNRTIPKICSVRHSISVAVLIDFNKMDAFRYGSF